MAHNRTKLFAAAAERNKEPILGVLKKYLNTEKSMFALEIASGTGQHIDYFASIFKNTTWLPSEIHQRSLASILSYSEAADNILKPVFLDITVPLKNWDAEILQHQPYDVILCINMIHISPLECTLGLFSAAVALLKNNGLLIIYGPFAIGGEIFPESNIQFDKHLKSLDSRFGLRDINYLTEIAKENSLILIGKEDMPANNYTLIFKKLSKYAAS